MKKIHLHLGLVAVAAVPLMAAEDSCGPDILDDPLFDLWCGDELCAWEIEEGAVEKVPTWHVAEDGASLVGDPVVISQLAKESDATVDCIQFSLTADVEEVDGQQANLKLLLDFQDDGLIDFETPLASDDYDGVSYFVTPPESYQDIRFIITKTGGGKAVIAQVRAQEEVRENCTDPPIQLAE
ncbi:MAG: hypothetical protein H6742_14140 [Alphaproteobacteria bacterium]|nr:hypothetical protein [Alphaproteobacteria bacterium]